MARESSAAGPPLVRVGSGVAGSFAGVVPRLPDQEGGRKWCGGGGFEGHALTPQALLRPGTPPISQLARWRHGGGSGFSGRNVRLGSPPFISGPSCLPLCSSPAGSSPGRWAGFYCSYWGVSTRIVRWVLPGGLYQGRAPERRTTRPPPPPLQGAGDRPQRLGL